MLARPYHDDWRPDVWIWIAILALWISASGRESTSFGQLQQSSHICVLERNPKAWLNTESHLDGLLNRSDWCKLEWFEASRHRGRFGRKVLVVRTDDGLDWCASGWYDTSSRRLVLWTAGRLGRYDTSSGRLAGNRIFWLANCVESSGNTSE
jgi:hypothetical protein